MQDTVKPISAVPAHNTRLDTASAVLEELRAIRNPRALTGMSRYGITTRHAYGIKIPDLRNLAKSVGKNHALALQLSKSGVHEARILAAMIDDPKLVTERQADRWVGQFDSWDLCDQVCLNLFVRTRFAYRKCTEWSAAKPEFVKRAGFALMACLAVGDKDATDKRFLPFLRLIERESIDGRNYVKNGTNWALRQIGKRSTFLNMKAVESARRIQKLDTPGSRWVGADALRELSGDAVKKRLGRR